MALKVNFEKSPLGIPIPECYVMIDQLLYQSITQSLRVNLAFYVNEAQRQNDIRVKMREIDLEIEAKKAEPPATEEEQQVLEISLSELYERLANVTGDSPFFQKIFEFPVPAQQPTDFLAYIYEQLKTVSFVSVENGRELAADFTQAEDV